MDKALSCSPSCAVVVYEYECFDETEISAWRIHSLQKQIHSYNIVYTPTQSERERETYICMHKMKWKEQNRTEWNWNES